MLQVLLFFILMILIFLFLKVRKLEKMLEQQQVEHNEILVALKNIKEDS